MERGDPDVVCPSEARRVHRGQRVVGLSDWKRRVGEKKTWSGIHASRKAWLDRLTTSNGNAVTTGGPKSRFHRLALNEADGFAAWMRESVDDAAILGIERPHPSLWTYYLLGLLVAFPLLPFFILPMWFRYHTMRYRFTDEGISMRWGILFRKEIIIQYARIQDIHLRSNVVERWLGLARVLIQTASGNAASEMTLEGLREFEAVRDFLYARMRGVTDRTEAGLAAGATSQGQSGDELSSVLHEVADELRALRAVLENGNATRSDGPV